MSREVKNLVSISVVFALGMFVFAGIAGAAVVGPYTVDANTLHLWHLDEAAGTGTAADVVGTANMGWVSGDATQGASTYAGFGSSILAGAGGCAGYSNTSIATAQSDYQGGNYGAFTYEAMVNVSTLTGAYQSIFTREGDVHDRCFQFRITDTGGLQFAPVQGGTITTVAIPTTGADAFVANEWFHTAVTGDGAGNLALYWTRVSDSATEANLIGTGSFAGFSDAQNGETAIGEQDRGFGDIRGLPILGSIDEVRVSSIARGADDMLFATVVPEPSTLALLATGLFGLLCYAWKKRK